MTPRLFAVGDLRAAVVPTLGKYSRLATMGPKAKDGATMDFNAETLGQMVDNFKARGDKLAICQDHLSAYVGQTGRPAPALGFFTSLAVVQDHKLVSFATVANDAPPDVENTDDGLWACLGEITPLGMDQREGFSSFAFLSPMFSESATDEAGNPIGFALYDAAVTNTPHQPGCAIAFSGSSATPGAHAMVELTKDGTVRVSSPVGVTVASPAAATTMANPTKAEWEAGLRGDEESLRRMEQNLATIRAGGKVENLTAENAARAIDGLKQAIANKRALISSMSAAPTRAGKEATTMAKAQVGQWVSVSQDARTQGGEVVAVSDGKYTIKDYNRGGKTVDGIDEMRIGQVWDSRPTSLSTSAPPRRFNQGATAMDPEKIAAMAGFEPDDDDAKKLAKCMAYMAEHAEPDGDEPEEVKAMAEDLGVEPGPKVMSRMRAALAATRAPVTAMAALQGEVKALSQKLAERDKADADAKINTFADDAIKAGRWDAGKRAELVTFARADIKAATASLLPDGTYTALARITAGLDSRGNAGGAMPDANGVQRFGVSLSAAAKKMSAEKGISFESALMECGKNPDLARDYLAR